MFDQISNTEKGLENTTRSGAFLTNFEPFRNVELSPSFLLLANSHHISIFEESQQTQANFLSSYKLSCC